MPSNSKSYAAAYRAANRDRINAIARESYRRTHGLPVDGVIERKKKPVADDAERKARQNAARRAYDLRRRGMTEEQWAARQAEKAAARAERLAKVEERKASSRAEKSLQRAEAKRQRAEARDLEKRLQQARRRAERRAEVERARAEREAAKERAQAAPKKQPAPQPKIKPGRVVALAGWMRW